MSTQRHKEAPHAWWSDPGPDTCEFCLQSFYLEVGYYCADCDRPICPVCTVHLRERLSVACPQCKPGEHD